MEKLIKYFSSELPPEYDVRVGIGHLIITRDKRSSVEMSLFTWDITHRDHTGMYHIDYSEDISKIEMGFYRSKNFTREYDVADDESAPEAIKSIILGEG